jgi:hypothetical protein
MAKTFLQAPALLPPILQVATMQLAATQVR